MSINRISKNIIKDIFDDVYHTFDEELNDLESKVVNVLNQTASELTLHEHKGKLQLRFTRYVSFDVPMRRRLTNEPEYFYDDFIYYVDKEDISSCVDYDTSYKAIEADYQNDINYDTFIFIMTLKCDYLSKLAISKRLSYLTEE